jgi:hydroxyethylthiazole kinase-like uncharacterized protein yjeF
MDAPPKLAPIYRSAELRGIEKAASALPLLERAGAAAADVAHKMASERSGAVLVLAGPGNNGGDAFVVARLLRQAFFEVVVVYRGDPATLFTTPQQRIAHSSRPGVQPRPPSRRLDGSVIVDGLFGIGLVRPLATADAALVEWATLGKPILALDILERARRRHTGIAAGPAIRARATATFLR